MKGRIVVSTCVLAGLVASGVSEAASQPPPPPRPPKPVSLTLKKSGRNLIVVVKCKNLTSKNARANTDNLALDVRTAAPKGEYGIQSNGPGMPVAVHPYGGNGSTSGPATLKISVKQGTETFTFALKAIHNPRSAKVRALNQARQYTRFYAITL